MMPNDTVPAAATGLPNIFNLDRRSFLRGAAPAAALTVTAAPVVAQASAEERARRAWAEFTDAMRELVRDGNGWMIIGGERLSGDQTGPFARVTRSRLMTDPRNPAAVIEGIEPIRL